MSGSRSYLAALAGSASLLALAYSPPAPAQQSAQTDQPAAGSSTGLDEIVVTARRREEKAQSVPLTITNVTAQDMERQQIKEVGDFLKDVPSLTYAGNRNTGGLSSGGSFLGNYMWIHGVP